MQLTRDFLIVSSIIVFLVTIAQSNEMKLRSEMKKTEDELEKLFALSTKTI